MLLRLVPPTPLPTILFTLTFPTLPQSLPVPAAWENHLQLLLHYELTAPPCLHALDKSVAWTALLDTVTFDLVSLTVCCVFVDGIQEEWPLTNRCVDLLDSVIRDVNRSASEAEIEHDLERRKTAIDHGQNSPSDSHASLSSSSCASPPVSEHPTSIVSKAQKPKKRRSILASLVTSLILSSSLSGLVTPSRASTPLPPPPSPPPYVVIEDQEFLNTNGIPASRFLRRRARSTLVDAYRRFVVKELGARFQMVEPTLYKKNGDLKTHGTEAAVSLAPRYALWVTRSTMRRVAEEMAKLIEFAVYASHLRDRERGPDRGTGRSLDKFRDDERIKDEDRDGDDAGSASSTTDGSSVHTPLDFHDTPFSYTPSSASQSKHHSLPSHAPTVMTPQAYQAYVSLKEMHHRLHGLARQLTSEASAQEQASAVEAGAAEVRSRRRAWSSRQYLARSCMRGEGTCGVSGGASMTLMGLAVPVRSSPLCRGWNAEELDAEDVLKAEGGRRVRWEREVGPGEAVRRARSLSGERSQRGRCYVEVTRHTCEAKDMHRPERRRPLGQDANPIGVVYSTGPRLSELGHDSAIDEEDEEDDKNEDNSINEDDDGDEVVYAKQGLTHPSKDAWSPSPQSVINDATMPKDVRAGRSIPALMTPKALPTAAVAIEEPCTIPSGLHVVDI